MPYKIDADQEYQQVMEKIETCLQKATASGGFHMLAAQERDDLRGLSFMAEAWEDHIPLMPIRQPRPSLK